MPHNFRDRGAAAVEFALVLIPLSLLTFGIIAVGYAFHVQTVLDNAARDAVRYYALSEPANAASAAEDAAASALTPTFGPQSLDALVTIVTPLECTAGEIVTVTLTYNGDLPLASLIGWDLQLKGSGSMRCNG